MYIVLFLVDLLCSKKLLQSFDKFFLYFFVIFAPWSVDFQMVLLFNMSLSFGCLFSIRQLREFLAKK